MRPDDLAALVVREAVARSGIDPALVEDVVLGNANGAGEENRNVARMAALLAGLPVEVAGQTINRLCGSGLQAVNSAAHAIMVGDGDVIVAGGVESMTRAPYVQLKPESAYARGAPEVADTTLGWRFVNPRLDARLPGRLARRDGRDRGRALGRQPRGPGRLRAAPASSARPRPRPSGRFDDQIVPVPVPQRDGSTVIVDRDEHPRPDTTAEALAVAAAGLPRGRHASRPATRRASTTAPRRSCSSRRTRARELGLRPLARIVSTAVAGVDPAVMGIGPVPATRKALERAGLASTTSTSSSSTRRSPASRSPASVSSGLDPERVNVNGGAIALGHPLGMSGARLAIMLVHELRGARRSLRPGDDVHRRRPGHRHGRGVARRGLTGCRPAGSDRPRVVLRARWPSAQRP